MEYPITLATRKTLSNGLTIILDPDTSAPVINVQAWVATGSIHENHKLGSGLSHFLEHMVFKGTRDYSSEELAQTVQAAGGHWNAYTTFDRTVYYIDGPSHSLETFLKCLTGLVFYPTLPESEFDSEKDVIRREIDMGLDDPDNASIRLLLTTAFTVDARRHPVIGHRHLFDEIAYQDLVDYHRKRYTPDKTHIVISGDFDPETATQKIQELCGNTLIVAGPEPHIQIDPPQLGSRENFDSFDVPTSRICLSWKAPNLSHPDAAAYDLLAVILGGGKSSRLYRHLRNKQEIALEISAWTWIGGGSEGLIAVSAETSPDKRDALRSAILGEISQLADCALQEDLAKVKRQTASSQFRSLISASGRASDLASNWHEARDLNFTRSHLAAIQAVTENDIRRVAATLTEHRLTYTSLDPLNRGAEKTNQREVNVLPEITTHTLSNGLRLAFLPDHRVPLIHIQAAVGAGLPSETPNNNGINQLFATSLTKGTQNRSADQIALSLESFGASMSASVGNNAMLVQAAGLAPDLNAILEIYSDVMLHPSFPEDAVAREKMSQLATLQEAHADPLHRCFKELRSAHYSGMGYGLDTLGTAESLAALTRENLLAHHSSHFHAQNVTLAISGDFQVREILPLLESYFAAMPQGTAWVAPASQCAEPKRTQISLPKKQGILAIGYPGADLHDEQRFALSFLQEYSSDMAGPLFGRIREELGLAYRVGATQFVGYDTGLFTFYLATSPEQMELAQKELESEIQKIAEQGIPEDAFERVRSIVLSGIAIQRQSPASNARHAALDLLFGHPFDMHRKLAEVYQNISHQDVKDAALYMLSKKPSISIILGQANGSD